MKKLIIFTLANLFIITSTIAQNNIWSLPPSYADFSSSPPTILDLPDPGSILPGNPLLGYDGTPAQYSHNAIQDAGGNLLFFIVDDVIYDKDGNYIDELALGSGTTGNGGTETMIVPDPGNCNRYYLFTSYKLDPKWYSILDFSALIPSVNFPSILVPTLTTWAFHCSAQLPQNPCWDLHNPLVSDVINHPNQMNISGMDWSVLTHIGPQGEAGYLTYAASQLTANNERYVYMQLRYAMIVFKIDANFIRPVDFYPFGFHTIDEGRGEMELVKLANGNLRLAFSYFKLNTAQIPKTSGFFYVDINPLTGIPIAGTENTYDYDDPLAFIHGIEFSPDGDYLYITHEKTTNNPSSIDVYQIGSASPIPVTNIPSLNAEDFENSEIEIGVDGKLYFAGNNAASTNGRLATYDNPNNPNSSPTQWSNSALSVNYNFNYASNPTALIAKTYLLPDQIDGMDYTESFFIDLACCIENTRYDIELEKANEYHNDAFAVWTGGGNNPFVSTGNVVTVKDKLVIETGANIFINNMIFKFAPKAQLIIENGAKLTINHTTLTVEDGCDTNNVMWQGVEVWGQPGFQPAIGGRFTANNNSVIEHAVEATANSQHILDANNDPITGSFNSNFNGGIISMTDSKLRNNANDARFEPYSSLLGGNVINDQSRFVNCEFITDAPLNDPSFNAVVLNHVLMYKVNGISFVGCDFINATTLNSPYSYTDRPRGIVSYFSKFTVSSRCNSFTLPCPAPDFDPSRFINLSYGIGAIGTTLKTAKITNSEFTNNWRGILLRAVDFAEVSNNTFDIGQNVNPGFPTSPTVSYGLYLDYCKGYKVDYNKFNTSYNGYLGIGVHYSGTGTNEIYKNDFFDLTIGSQAMKTNGDGSAATNAKGLEFRCNEFNNTSDYDILVSSGQVRSDQGSCNFDPKSPANNQFSYTAQFGDYWLNDFPTVSITSTYHYSSGGAGFNLEPRTLNGGFSADFINPFNTSINECSPTFPAFNLNNSCPVRIKKTKGQLKAELSTGKLAIATLRTQLDGNNTTGLINMIQQQPAMPASQLKDTLEDAEPLSSQVLLALVNSNFPVGNLEDILKENSPLSSPILLALINSNIPAGNLEDILEENSPLSTGLILALLNKANPVPFGILKDILEESAPLSPFVISKLESMNIPNGIIKDILEDQDEEPDNNASNPSDGQLIEQEIAFYETTMSRATNDLMRLFLFDEVTDKGYKKVADFIQQNAATNTNKEEQLLVNALMANQDFVAAQQKINALDVCVCIENIDFCKLNSTIVQCQQYPEKEMVLNTNMSLQQPVNEVASATTGKQEVASAQVLRQYVGLETYTELIEMVVSGSNLRVMPDDEVEETVVQSSKINLYPNPTKEQFYLTHNLSLLNGEITLNVFDLMGRKMMTKQIKDAETIVSTRLLKTGVYFYTITQNNTTIKSDKLMIK